MTTKGADCHEYRLVGRLAYIGLLSASLKNLKLNYQGLSRQHDDGSHFLPPLVMAKRDGYDMLGLLVPKLLAFDAGCSKLICDGAHEVALDYS